MILLVLKITALLAIALAVTAAMRRSSAAMRHLICACGLAGALLLALTLLTPPGPSAFRISALSVPNTIRTAPAAPRVLEFRWIWLAGTALLLGRIALGYLRLGALLRDARAYGPRMFFADVSVPVAAGLLRPVILLPRDAEDWPAGRLNAALRHEREHLRRKDLWTLLLSHLACAVYWFHPLAWLLAAQLRREQEQACDDAVILSGFEPASYAEALLAAAQNLTSTHLIGCPMLTRKTFQARIARLLAGGIPRVSSYAMLRGVAVIFTGVVIAIGLLSGKPYNVQPHVISRIDPTYTAAAHADKLTGTVLLSVVIETDGTVGNIKVVKGLGDGLNEKAVEAVQQWRFAPGIRGGQPARVRAQIEINFRLL